MKRLSFDPDGVIVVTGASSGMGKEFAQRLTSLYPCRQAWLIARNGDKLRETADLLKIPSRVIPLDLSEPESMKTLSDLLEKEKPKINILVNAAGYGKFGAFSDIPLEEQLGMVSLNCQALIVSCRIFSDYMPRGSRIINLGSLSSFQPVPYINVYGASKALVLSFSRALNKEWKKSRGIGVLAVCPGWVKTDFFKRAVSDDTISYYNRFYTPSQVADRLVRDLEKDKDVSVCGFPVRAQVLLTKLLPHRLVMWIWCRQQKKN